jgi:hypothetical protein
MPALFASSSRSQSSLSASAPGRPSLFRTLLAFAQKLTVAFDLGLDDAQAGPDARRIIERSNSAMSTLLNLSRRKPEPFDEGG